MTTFPITKTLVLAWSAVGIVLRVILPEQGDTYRRQPPARSMHSWKLRVKRIALSLGVLARATEFMGHFCRHHRLRRHWLCKLYFTLKPWDHPYPTSRCRVQLVCLATGFWLVANPRTRPVHYGETASVCIVSVLRLKLDVGTSHCYDSAFASDMFRGR
jgi:hypothetical protein